MKVYMIGNTQDAAAFEHAEISLRQQGFIPINPIKILQALPAEINNSDFTVIAFEIIRVCDAVYLLHGWEMDLMARMEAAHAKRTEKEIYYSVTRESNNMNLDCRKDRS